MDKHYQPDAIETACYGDWEKKNYFAPSGGGAPYCIMLPPPNVTGSLHMGHAFQQTLMDILIRYHRMRGCDTLWQCGVDHAGIATQMVVERQLQAGNSSRQALGREKFVEAVWDWKTHSGDTIMRQSKRLGTSMDWSRERFTMDASLSGAVTEVFVRLYEEGLIYRGKRLVNWDPVLHTAISDLEVIAEEEDGYLWYMRYPLEAPVEGMEYIVVATTRPETMLGDTAVAVHPDDERYRHLIGKRVLLPLTERKLPVIADDYVDPEFGTGCVKITPAHDFNDYDVGERHQLEKINIFTVDATLNEQVPEKYRGLDRYAARQRIVEDLEASGLLEKTEKHTLTVPRGDRSHAVVEPYLTDQWYVRVEPLVDPAIRAVKDGDIKFVPESWGKTYFEWMRNIEDWCISRQLWWGHRIPAWYDNEGNIYVGRNEAEVRASHDLGGRRLRQDEDVLDTWFSSSLWPFSTLGWPEKTPELEKFYPTSVLVTGFDIIFFWVARMIMMGLKFIGDVPFREVYITGLVRDAEGQKMSKSKGNILDPLDLIDGIEADKLLEKLTTGLMQPQLIPAIKKATHKQFPDGIAAYGTDSLRFTFANLATQGRDIRFDIGRIEGNRNFCNKLWNAVRYILMQVDSTSANIIQSEKQFGPAERWINAKLSELIEAVHEGMRTYRFDLASRALYEFTWHEYCGWYLELSKVTLNDDTTSMAEKQGTVFVLLNVMEILLRILHPFMPFITEALWRDIATCLHKPGASIMVQAFPQTDDLEVDTEAVVAMEWIKSFVTEVRRIRAEHDIAPGKTLTVFVRGGTPLECQYLEDHQHYIKKLARLNAIQTAEINGDDTIIALVGEMTLSVPWADSINPVAEEQRLRKIIAKLQKEKTALETTLANENFRRHAPVSVIENKNKRLADVSYEIGTHQQQLGSIAKLL